MQEQEEREAHWECPECKQCNVSEIDIPEIDMLSDKARDYHASDLSRLECDGCDTVFEGTIYNSISGPEFGFQDHSGNKIEVEHVSQNDDYQYDEEYEYSWEPSDDPNDVFEVTIDGMQNLLCIPQPSQHDDQLLNRVVFSQVITAVEAYLADTLINLVRGNSDIQLRLYSTDKDLKKVKFEASKILARPLIPENHLVSWLQRKSFHDFPMVNKLFEAALGKSIFQDTNQEDLMNQARLYRHDCVHRNGKNKDGDKIEVFDQVYVKSIMTASQSLVSNIENLILSYQSPQTT